ncbi:MAG: hypothetical protein HC842_07820, partial [Cytophagales bacterium]|nr:hypothetical protein [Cytophagales bacterium]
MALPLRAELRLPHLFSDHMVLQQQKSIPIWGWDAPGQSIKIVWRGKVQSTECDAQGKWKTELPATEAGGPHQLSLLGSTSVVIKDIWVGEVWLAAGQSNMEWSLADFGKAEAIKTAYVPGIRVFDVPNRYSDKREDSLQGEWKVCSPQAAKRFFGGGLFFCFGDVYGPARACGYHHRRLGRH